MMKGRSLLQTADARGKTAAGETLGYFLQDLWGFMRVRKKFWLLPAVVTLVFFGAVVALSSGSAIAPFVYTLF
ncbi:MAG: hypothetical protein C4567_00115 [Deltaproteobacteria bacterium]|nr:MAG: hypothetical protein C4567_00115 [Deltaproteobacteria bacterium]